MRRGAAAALLMVTLAACAPDLPDAPSATPLPPAGARAGGVTPPAAPPVLPRADNRVPDNRAPDNRNDEDYARSVTRQPRIPLPEHVPRPDRDLPGLQSWPPSQRDLQGLDRSPFQGPGDAPIGREPCPAGMVHCR